MLRTRADDDRGAVSLVVALMATVLVGLAALVIDLGMARDETRTAQNAADAAALAAAQRLSAALDPEAVTTADIDAARAAADAYVAANGWASGIATFQVNRTAQTVTLALTPVQSPRFFAGALGADTPTVGASAQATWTGATAGCAVCVLGSLTSRNGQVLASTGSILIDGDVTIAPNGSITSVGGIVGVAGTVTGANATNIVPPASPIAGVTDPFETAPTLPPTPPAPRIGLAADPAPGPTCDPGTYSLVTACRTFNPGVYVIADTNRFSGNVTIDASRGVFFYVTCSTGSAARGNLRSANCAQTGQTGGSLNFAGTVGGTINAPADPAYRGLAIAYDRHNTADVPIVGTPALVINGGVYAKSGTLVNSGNGAVTINGTLVVGQVDLNGAPSTITINGATTTAPRAPMLVHLTR